jgi:GNAT superfamily N-acetyltransferase
VENVLIREAGAEDAAAIARLLGQLGYSADEKAVRQRLDALLASRADVLLVAVVGDDPVGFAVLHVSIALERDGPAGKLSAIVVDEQHRSRGIGRRLVAAIEVEARRRGCVLLFLTTSERRRDAHAFYRKLGYEETGRRFAKTLE